MQQVRAQFIVLLKKVIKKMLMQVQVKSILCVSLAVTL